MGGKCNPLQIGKYKNKSFNKSLYKLFPIALWSTPCTARIGHKHVSLKKRLLGNSCILSKYSVFLGILPLPRSSLKGPGGGAGRTAGS